MERVSIVIFFAIACVLEIQGHGMLWDPPGRSTLWRFHPDAPTNFNDNALYCGGAAIQWQQNNGKCGVCGDNYQDSIPRENENGGKYGTVKHPTTYFEGTNVQIRVNITASHLGHFEFSLCDLKNIPYETEDCFQPLMLLDGTYNYNITPELNHAQPHYVYLRLPSGKTCNNCVLRWHYRAGNSVGLCDDGSMQLGCGAQETFRNCADIRIVEK